jgi:AsmA protein
MRKALIVIGIIVGVLVIAAVALPFFVNADSFRPRIEAEMEHSLGRKVQIGKLSLSLLAGGVTADDISITDDPAFSNKPFVHAKSLDVGVDMGALIFSRTLHVRSLTLVEPEVSLLHTASGKWNFSSLGVKAEKQPASSANTDNDLSVEKLRVLKGAISVGDAKGKTYVYSDVGLEASNVSYSSPIPFTLEAGTPGGGRLKVEGHAGPIDGTDASRTPLQASVNVTGTDMAKTGFFGPDSGLAGMLDYDGTATSDGKFLHSEGTAKVQQLRLVKNGSPARQPVSFKYATDYDLVRRTGVLNNGEVHTGNSVTRLSGNYDAHGTDTIVHLKLNGRDLPIQDVSGLLPALGVALPGGSSLQGGSVTANLNVDGALDKLVTTGDLNVANVKLTGFNIGSRMSAIGALAGIHTGNDTTIQMMSSKLRIAPEGIRADNLNVLVPELGTVTGAGTVANNNSLNFKMNAKLASGGGMVGNLTKIAGLGQAASNKGIPFMIQGTTANPVFLPDVGGMMGNTVQAPAEGLGGIFGGFFGKKKKQ